MNKEKIKAFFDRLAPNWDEICRHDPQKIARILDLAAITKDSTVFDVACGTGVLFPFYVERDVKRVIGMDICAAMIAKAREKSPDSRIELIVGDAEKMAPDWYDRCMIYSAMPHFESPARLISFLSGKLAPQGRLTVAHSESRAVINQTHQTRASDVAMALMPAAALAKLFAPHLSVDILVDDHNLYVVSGTKIDEPCGGC